MRRVVGAAFRFLLLSAALFISGHSGPHEVLGLRKLDSGLRDRLYDFDGCGRYRERISVTDNGLMDVFVRTVNEDNLRRHGVRARTFLNGIATASAGRAAIESLMSDPEVSWIGAVGSYEPALDVSLAGAGVTDSKGLRPRYNGTQFTGRGVLVGIVDTGIDWSHDDFIDPGDGASRILRLWDQTENSGRPPSGFEFGFGTEYFQSEITREVRGHTSGAIHSVDAAGHGTHVAGIACGNGSATGNGHPAGRYAGVAPEAGLIVVKVPEQFNSDAVLAGIRYVFSKADSLNRPAVVNLSLAAPTQEGPHDGSTAFEQSVDAMLGDAGKAIVVSAGNFGGQAAHFRGEFASMVSANSTEVRFRIGSNNPGLEDAAAFDIWYSPAAELAVTVAGPGGGAYGPVSSFSQRRMWESAEDGLIDIDNASFGPDPNNGDMRLRIRISDDYRARPAKETLRTGEWRLVFTGLADSERQRPSVFHGWLFDSNAGTEITEGGDDGSMIPEPGNARLCITAGGYTSRSEWPRFAGGLWGPGGLAVDSIAAFSGSGPPRQNSRNSASENKPELAAPGEYVLSSFSRFISSQPDSHFIAADGVHIAMHGTSMAAPHVTGVIALMLQADPNLDSYQIKRFLINGAGKSGAMWDRRWGYGKLDAESVLRTLTPVEEEVRASLPDGWILSPNFPNPFNASTSFRISVPAGGGRMPSSLAILDPSGRTRRILHRGFLEPGEHGFVWDGTDDRGEPVASGIYICRITVSRAQWTGKLCCIR